LEKQYGMWCTIIGKMEAPELETKQYVRSSGQLGRSICCPCMLQENNSSDDKSTWASKHAHE
jgi:hypothetical protein